MYQNVDRSTICDSIFHLLTLESINYILNKKIENKQKIQEIEGLGAHLGERISNHLLNSNYNTTSSTKMEVNEIMKFLGRDVWIFLFGKQISKLQTNSKGTYLIDCDEIRFHHLLINEKLGCEEVLEFILQFVSGVIKGVISAFNLEGNVNANFKPGPIIGTLINLSNNSVENKSGSSIGSTSRQSSEVANSTNPVFSYSFTINLSSHAL